MVGERRLIARCRAADMADSDIRKCQGSDGQAVAIYRQGGQYFATQDRCSHALASLSEGWMEGYEVFCPVHEARFDVRTGKAMCFPATEPVQVYDVEVSEDGEIVVMEKIK